MKCPYNLITNEFSKYNYEYFENGEMSDCDHLFVQSAVFQECLKEECAAWYNGRCNYKG